MCSEFRERFEGNYRIVEEYVNGQKNGISKKYAPNGKIVETINYKNDVKHGEKIDYMLGSIYCKSMYENGLQHGDEIVYHIDGNGSIKK